MRLEVSFFGTVQGVGFRYTAHRIATRYKVYGYVANMRDGSVFLAVEGEKDEISAFIEDLKKSMSGYISHIVYNDSVPEQGCTSFDIRHRGES